MAAPAAADTGGPRAGEDDADIDVDVVILGAGPAGAAAAITLRRYTQLRVALVERRLFDPFRPGETVSPALFPLVDYLGIARASFEERHLQSYAHAAAWGGDELVVRDFLFNGQGSGLHLDRLAFDSMLLDQAGQLGARIVQPAELLAISGGERWSVALRQGQAKRALSAAYLIDCSGRSSVMVRQQQCAVLQTDRMVGVYAYYDASAADGRERLQRTLVETTENGWFYLAPLPGGRTAAAFMTDAESLRTLDLLDPDTWRRHALASTHIGPLVRALGAPQAFRQYPVHSRVARLPANAAWTAAGDAAASFDPVSSLGIGHALSSGIQAARVAHAYLEQGGGLGEGYRQSLLDHFQSYAATRRSLYANEQRWPQSGFWQRRTGALCAQGQDGSRTRPNPGLGPAAGSSDGMVRTRSTSIK
ncbi:FAD-dependent monooxygenase [Massilia aquatica]|uniref:FAD-binding domain-containing protein n=1 Tax=Massilia aquatica TaxID=2609000 RepID=A0ABX0MF10_9BURK|nr:FAD-dependent monooxygenase [Massilia aquatica]NHZ43540.1 hypothetical protein [Massilia aquatica]